MSVQGAERSGWLGLWRTPAVAVVFWSAPLWAALFPRLFRHKTLWLVDFDAVVCGAQRLNAHQPIYSAGATCGGSAGSAFVYPPWVATAFSYPVRWAGDRMVLAGYAVLFLAALLFLFWAVFWRKTADLDRSLRTPFLAFTTGNLVFIGNIAVVMQAAVLAAALFLGADTIACTAAILVAGLIKPIYLTFLALPAFAATHWARRGALVVIAGGLVGGLCLSHLPLVPEWRAFLPTVAVDPHPGGGLLGWLGQLGIRDHLALGGIYVIYAGLLFAAGLAIAELGRLSPAQRVWLAATVGVLLLPRVMAYDLLLLGPGLLVASQAVRSVSARVAAAASVLWLAACGLYLVSSLLGGVYQIGHAIALMLVDGGLLWVGAVVVLKAPWGAPNPATAPTLTKMT